MADSENVELARSVAESAARRSYGKLVAFLAARTRDVAAAEDALSEAFASALSDWPANGCPANPEGWLLTVARRKMIDAMRGRQRHEVAAEELRVMAEGAELAEMDTRLPDILQVVLGLDAKAIASAFLTSPAAMGKRLVRAKEKIKQAGIPFAIPERAELPVRLDAVLEAIYAAFAEGWSDPSATDISRRDLTEETLFLARLVVELLPSEAEALGLLALMLHAEARRFSRRTCAGEYVPLSKQDMRLWDAEMIREAEELLLRASELGVVGRFQLEGALQSAHVHRRRTGAGNWREVVRLYDALLAVSGSPVVGINRALALAEVEGPGAGLRELDDLAKDTRLGEYQPYWAARAELLTRARDYPEAKRSYELAIGLERDEAVRKFLLQRMSELPN